MRIVNLTQHTATPEQIAAGVIEPSDRLKAMIRDALTFPAPDSDSTDGIPTAADIHCAAEVAAARALDVAGDAEAAMIGGAPYLMASLERALRERGITPLYAYSERETVEAIQDDGSVVKRNVFRHLGFIPAV